MAGRHDTVVVKIGTSSITDDEGVIDRASVGRLCDGVAALRSSGRRVVVVTSGAIAAGLPELGLGGSLRPRDAVTLQAVSAVGQGGLIRTYREELGRHDLIAGQVLLAPLDFFVRAQYLHARGTLARLLELGVVPVVNLEWIQKINRDTGLRGYSEKSVVDTILRRMPDYVHYIVPQFRHSDINFQRVPVVDTSNPIIANDVPTIDESVVVVRFRKPEDFNVDFPWLLRNLDGSWMSRRNTIVVPGGKMSLVMQMTLTPIIDRMMEARESIGSLANTRH